MAGRREEEWKGATDSLESFNFRLFENKDTFEEGKSGKRKTLGGYQEGFKDCESPEASKYVIDND